MIKKSTLLELVFWCCCSAAYVWVSLSQQKGNWVGLSNITFLFVSFISGVWSQVMRQIQRFVHSVRHCDVHPPHIPWEWARERAREQLLEFFRVERWLSRANCTPSPSLYFIQFAEGARQKKGDRFFVEIRSMELLKVAGYFSTLCVCSSGVRFEDFLMSRPKYVPTPILHLTLTVSLAIMHFNQDFNLLFLLMVICGISLKRG